MVQIVFTDPPPPARRPGRSMHPWEEIAEQLKARPGEWALCLRDMHDSSASSIRLGKLAAFQPPGAWEARAVRPTDRHQNVARGKDARKQPIFDLYIRYVGHEKTADNSDKDA